MKKLAGVFVFVLCAGTLLAQDDVTHARWADKTVVTDGHIDEWQLPFNLFDNKTGLVFTMSNDKQNLYLCFTTKDEVKAEKLMKAGWVIELSSTEKKRKFNASISFPPINDPNISLHGEYRNQVSYYKMNLATVETKGFVSANGATGLAGKNGINIGIGSENEYKIIYEIAIPLGEMMEADKIQLTELLTLDITVNGLGKPAGHTAAAATNFNTGKMGRMGGRRGGGNMAANNNAMEEGVSIYDKVGFKQKVKLVPKD